MIRIFLLLGLFCSISHAHADQHTLIDQWYTALKTADRTAFENLLSEEAEIELINLGIVQSKIEFIESLDAWQDAKEGLKLKYAYEGIDATSASSEVCYRFPSNSFTNLEVFTVFEDKIVRHSQERLREGCDD